MIKRARNTPDGLFADLPPGPAEHFKIYLFGTILGFIGEVAEWLGSFEQAMERFPFLVGYNNDLATRLEGLPAGEAFGRWWTSLEAWERGVPGHLPLRALREAVGLKHTGVMWLMTLGLVEEDTGFGTALEFLQGTPGQRRPTFGFLRRCWQAHFIPESALALLTRLRELGLAQVLNPEAPRQDWTLQVPGFLWDAVRGSANPPIIEWARYRPPAELVSLEELIVPPDTLRVLQALPQLLQTGETRAVVVRGPLHNGRHTTLGAVARSLGRGVLELRGLDRPDDDRWRQTGALALLLNAVPVIEYTPAPGETISLPDLKPASTVLGVVLGQQGGLSGPFASHTLALKLEMPDLQMRREQWSRCLVPANKTNLVEISEQFRLSTGNIQQAARLARGHAALAGRDFVEPADVLAATRALNRQTLDTLARRVPAASDLNQLCAGERTLRELEHLERHCRHRERLPLAMAETPGGISNCGVRALFTGPSGTGKTLAARLLAASLHKDLYQLDLSAVVNKFIGETEKNLQRILDCAEELDIILLLDEGDALLTRRTDVQNANDRYANLETDFLLQRLESFGGLLIVTTNTRDRIDPAFERRMDVVVEFHVPDAAERWQLWQSHLPGTSSVDEQLLNEVASGCELTGGQIRNAALHAALLALDNGGVVTSPYVEAAVRREYLKLGAICPLRSYFRS
jgi:ATPase family associated with various cellular activities (AAA)